MSNGPLEAVAGVAVATSTGPAKVSAVCACGAGWPGVAVTKLGELHAEIQEHLRKRHPTASAYGLNLSIFPRES